MKKGSQEGEDILVSLDETEKDEIKLKTMRPDLT